MTDQKLRMDKLRALFKKKHKLGLKLKRLEKETFAAQRAYDKASKTFSSYQDDLIGDLFNGCFGEEWLLIDMRELPNE